MILTRNLHISNIGMKTVYMVGECYKSCLLITPNGEMMNSTSTKAMINYDKDSDKEYILEVNVKYPKELYRRHSNRSFLPDKIKINKCEKLACNFFDQKNYVTLIKALMQMLNIL